MSIWATKAQNSISGTTIMDTVSSRDLTSGPKISLPPKKNLCKRFTRLGQLRGEKDNLQK